MKYESLLQYNPALLAFIATLFTWLMTALGASMVFFFKSINKKVLNSMLGFAAGVMIAASFWSLLKPSIDMAEEMGMLAWVPAIIGFLAGGGLLFSIDRVLPHLHMGLATSKAEGIKTSWQRSVLLVLAITLSRLKAFNYGQLSGLAEPIAGLIGVYLVLAITPILPYALSFAAGAMIYVVVEELIPESQIGDETDLSTVGTIIGFALMMLLDVAFG